MKPKANRSHTLLCRRCMHHLSQVATLTLFGRAGRHTHCVPVS
jgi:hypothetical protein